VTSYEHVTFDTVPWKTAQEGLQARAIFDEWRKTRCLKTVEDFEDREDHYICVTTFERLRAAGQSIRFQITNDGLRGILLRILLIAYATQRWGGNSYRFVQQLGRYADEIWLRNLGR